MKKLSGMWAVVTGASSGIGEEYARQLAEMGASILVVARREERLRKLCEELKSKHGVETDFLPLDLTQDDSAERLFAHASRGGRKVQILVNNAGTGAYGPFTERPLTKHRDTVKLNLSSLTDTSYLFVNHMRAHGLPSYISNVASIAAFLNVPNFAVYSGTKFYVRAFSEALHFELKSTNVAVSCLCPGGTTTEFLENAGQKLTAQGRMAMMPASAVARVGIRAMLAGKVTVAPGLMNKFITLLPRFLPTWLFIPVAAFTMKQSVNMVEAK
ncbi:MAG: SDR family oxidoreductase [Bdellovibrionales bacterium]|nr:SDR family oxidoreductase [Bdellovibrionales bacterium]